MYLDPLDWLMAGWGLEMVWYADDMVVLCRTRERAAAALETMIEPASKPENPGRIPVATVGCVPDYV